MKSSRTNGLVLTFPVFLIIANYIISEKSYFKTKVFADNYVATSFQYIFDILSNISFNQTPGQMQIEQQWYTVKFQVKKRKVLIYQNNGRYWEIKSNIEYLKYAKKKNFNDHYNSKILLFY